MSGFSRRKLLAGGAGTLAAAAVGGAAFRELARAHGKQVATRAGVAFGTTVALTFAGPDAQALEASIHDGFSEIRALERAASLMRPDSELSRLNRAGALDRPDPRLVALASYALALAERSGGAFDPTVQPLWTLWERTTRDGRRPDEAERAEAVARVGWRDVEVSGERIAFRRPGVEMTLNGILQGYAADLVIAAARRHGVADAFVDTGEFGAFGRHPDGRPWRLGGRTAKEGGETDVLSSDFQGFAATSAGAGTPFSKDGADNHIFDPATGLSPQLLSRVAVFAPSGIEADGLSTAIYVMGKARGEALLAGRPGYALDLM
ncbi:FAD:protein FMN transferase [Chenggangzhangella methanolivorans]|uniref:FAD:protein FMN transferase n=1 Tax=Chenggangzhangella methanolivorans TaxID=1437009 RepID=UPI00361B000E